MENWSIAMTQYLPEVIVQHEALDWLERHYREDCLYPFVSSEKEVSTKPTYWNGRGRADGLLILSNDNQNLHVATMEAKSRKTLGQIIEGYDDGRWLLHAFLIGFAISLGITYFTRMITFPILRWVLPLVVFFSAASLFLRVTANAEYYRFPSAYQQLLRYPANFQWLAFCVDVFLELEEADRERLLRIVKSRKLGLLIVKERGTVYPLVHARRKRTPVRYGSFLDAYTNGEVFLA
jgi:hypothetical protein